MKDIYEAAEEAFGSYPQPEPYIGMRMKTGKKFNKTHSRIYDLYKADRTVVDDEMMLVAEIWSKQGWDSARGLYINLKHVTHPETISRRRRELHEAGLIEYSPKAMKSREKAFKSEREKASPIPPQVRYEPIVTNGERIMKLVNEIRRSNSLGSLESPMPSPLEQTSFIRNTE